MPNNKFLNKLRFTFALGSVINPLPNIDISICMYQSTIAMSNIIFPVPLIKRPIFPLLYSSSIPLILLPLPFVHIFLLKLYWLQVLCVLNFEVRLVINKHLKLFFLLFYHIIRIIRHLLELNPACSKFLVHLSLVEFGSEN